MIEEYTDQILISWLSEYRYCHRRFYLKVLERQDMTNEYIAEGAAAHTAFNSFDQRECSPSYEGVNRNYLMGIDPANVYVHPHMRV